MPRNAFWILEPNTNIRWCKPSQVSSALASAPGPPLPLCVKEAIYEVTPYLYRGSPVRYGVARSQTLFLNIKFQIRIWNLRYYNYSRKKYSIAAYQRGIDVNMVTSHWHPWCVRVTSKEFSTLDPGILQTEQFSFSLYKGEDEVTNWRSRGRPAWRSPFGVKCIAISFFKSPI